MNFVKELSYIIRKEPALRFTSTPWNKVYATKLQTLEQIGLDPCLYILLYIETSEFNCMLFYIYIYIKADRNKKTSGLKILRPNHRMELMRKSYIFSWLLFLLVSSSRITTYSLLNWPKVYIPHWWDVYWKSVGIMPFSRIFLTALFDTLTNNVLFLFLILHLFKCVALLCIYIIVIIILLIYIWDFNSIMYVFSYGTPNIYSLGLFLSHTLTTKNFSFLLVKSP